MSTSLNDRYQSAERWRAVVDHKTGTLVVNAGPGTGKTFSLLKKIGALLESGVPAHRIFYLTFVNSIVDAFKKDIAKPVDAGGLGATVEELGFEVLTLHSLAFKIIRTYHDRLGLPEEFQVVDPSPNSSALTSDVIFNDLVTLAGAEHGGRKGTKKQLGALLRHWQKGEAVPAPLQPLEAAFTTIRSMYQVLPWDLTVSIANGAIAEFGLPSWLQAATHFLVDEFQDFNPTEQRHIELISEPSDSTVIVGDVDQSIYSGRSASPEGLKKLITDDDVATVNFVLCRRCPRAVIAGANRILRLMDPGGWEARKLEPHREEDGSLILQAKKSLKAEIADLKTYIDGWIKRGATEIVILFPARKVLDAYRKALEEAGVNCGESKGADDLLRVLLELSLTPDQPFLQRVLLSTYPALERRFAEDVLPAMTEGATLEEALERALKEKRWRRDTRAALEEFKSDLKALRERNTDEVVKVLERKGFEVDAAELNAFFQGDDADAPRKRVQTLLDRLKPTAEEKPTVRLLTMHSAKGLSAPIVVLPGCEDKWIPGAAAGDRLEEQTRLFYVALTRATTGVLITHPTSRARRDPLNYLPEGTRVGPSRFAEAATSEQTQP